jgi:DNA-binding IclR family transcriptional regulator
MPKTKQNASVDGVWAVSLAFQILETLAQGEKAWRVTDLANELGTSKTRIFRYLQTLMNLGYVSQEADTDRYRIGIRLAYLGNAAAMSFDIVSMSRPMLHRLRDSLRQAVILSKVENGKIYIVDKVDGLSTISINAVIGTPLELHCSAQGKLLLAYSEPSLLADTIAAGLPAVTPGTITDPARLAAEVERVREQGWATAPSETLTGLNVAAVPIFDHKGQVTATLGILGSVDEIDSVPAPEQLAELKAAAQEISFRLYGVGKPTLPS